MDMIERVARNLHDEWFGVGGWSSLSDHDRKRWVFMARAAIEAMMEPTEGMLSAGETALPSPVPLRASYNAMIRAALEEGK